MTINSHVMDLLAAAWGVGALLAFMVVAGITAFNWVDKRPWSNEVQVAIFFLLMFLLVGPAATIGHFVAVLFRSLFTVV